MCNYLVILHSVNGWWEDEHYWFATEEEAVNYMNHFTNDGSENYTHITVENFNEGTVLNRLDFGNALLNTES